MNNLESLAQKKQWYKLISSYTPKEICEKTSFETSMRLMDDLFYENFTNTELQEYALDLGFQIKKFFPKKWVTDWKNEAFLGNMCAILWRYDDQYNCFKRALELVKDPPESLLLLLAGCINSPGDPPISDAESECYLLKAIEKKRTYEGALKMRALYERKGEKNLEQYWDNESDRLEKANIRSGPVVPDVLKENSWSLVKKYLQDKIQKLRYS